MKQLKVALIALSVVLSLFLTQSSFALNQQGTDNGWIVLEVGNSKLGYKTAGQKLTVKASQAVNLHVRAYHPAGIKYFEFQINQQAKNGEITRQTARSAYQYQISKYNQESVSGHSTWWQQRIFDQDVSGLLIRARAVSLNGEELETGPVWITVDSTDCYGPW